MEFEIDATLVERIAAREYAQARAEIDELGAIEALRRSQRRHDERLAAAADAHTLVCKAGCYWCCYFSVDVRPVEVFAILEHVQQHCTNDEKARIRSEIEANAAQLENLTEHERASRNIKCPFLVAGRCSIYAVRPQTCRNYHATDAAGCQKAFEQPDNLDIDPEFAPLTYQTGGAHVEAFSKAMLDAGYDVAAYELNSALLAATYDITATRRRFESKQSAFSDIPSADVPNELIDID